MKKYLLAAAAAAATMIAVPATARDGSIYVGIEGGIIKPKDFDGGAFVKITQSFNPTSPGPGSRFDNLGYTDQRSFDGGFGPQIERGYDIDAILGYDFGFLRVEGELGYKRANRKGFDARDDLVGYVNGALNRSSGLFALPTLTDDDFDDIDGKITFTTKMINALVELGNENGLSVYAGGGGGGGRAWAAALNDRDRAFAYQLIAGARHAVSRNIDFGLKYRHFRTGRLNFEGGPVGVNGNDRGLVGPGPEFVPIILSRSAQIFPEFGGKYKSHSLLASLTYNFGRVGPRPLPPPLAPPPPTVAPEATQTCPDGTMIAMTDSCPLPPPPLPSPAPERG